VEPEARNARRFSYEQCLSAASEFLERLRGHAGIKNIVIACLGVHVKNNFPFSKSLRALAVSALLGLSLQGVALAQPSAAQGETVAWTVQASDVAKGKATLTLNGAVREGWHVYSLKQLPEGPTPLLVTVDQNDVAKAGGTVAGSAPTKIHDPAFGLDTQFYESAFSLTVPVRLGGHASAGPQSIPLSVRFQTCNGRVCQPPKTVHLSASINLPAGG
jgi:hypothetical protein